MITIIAEKPSVAFDIARVLNVTNKKEGYLTNDKYAVTWAFGHLVQIDAPNLSEKWCVENLPILPDNFILKCRQKKIKDKSGKLTSVDDEGCRKQINIIQNLFSKSEEIIVATDAGREGELICRYIDKYLSCNKPFKRLWIRSLTDSAIKEGFATLKEGSEYDNLFYGAQSRSESDWLVGINATQALTLATGNRDVLSLGRVQTPTLAIICRRFLENKYFVPEPFFTVFAVSEKSSINFKFKTENYKTKETAESIVQTIKNVNRIEITEVERKEISQSPPLLHDLTSLQREANKRYGMTPDDTLDISQKLYESKYITYPRTGSCYIGEDVFATIPRLIERHKNIFPVVSHYVSSSVELSKRSVNDSKVTDHHALLPTELIADTASFSINEKNIYTLIVGRMLEAFHLNSLSERTTVKANCGVVLNASGTVAKSLGWKEVFLNVRSEEDEEEKEEKLPTLLTGEILPLIDSFFKEDKTKPKPLLNDASLLSYMETCGKEIEDQEAKDAIKDSGIGTPATRAEIINILIKREYINRNKKNLIPTEKGLIIYDFVKNKTIGSPEMTGNWEKGIEEISRGELRMGDFLNEIKKYTRDLVSELLDTKIEIKHTEIEKEFLKCPKCGKQVRIWEKSATCSANKKDEQTCDFILWRNFLEKSLTDNQLKSLIEGSTISVKGLKSKKGTTFDAKLKLNAEFKIDLIFDNPKTSKK